MGNYDKQLIEIQSTLLNYAQRLTGDINDAQDLLQETSLRILRKNDHYTENGKFRSWAMVVMKNQFKNSIRGNGKETQSITGKEYTVEENCMQLCEGEGEYHCREIEEIINSMTHKEAEILKMRILGYKYDEIAQLLAKPIGTIRSELFYAKNKLLKKLDGYNIN